MIDLLGQKFEKLTVLRKTDERTKHGSIIWECQCDCGNKVKVSAGNLRSGNTNSCGCYNKQRIRETQIKQNEYDLTGEYGIGYTSKGEEFYFDLEDYHLLENNCWCCNNDGYLIATERGNRKKFIYLSRVIMKVLDSDFDVDHINHNVKDNRKSNLRIVTRTQNNMNRSLQSNNTSGTTGVCFDKRLNKWHSRINVEGKQINLGFFSDYDEAVRIRKQAEIKYFGEYRYKGELVNG